MNGAYNYFKNVNHIQLQQKLIERTKVSTIPIYNLFVLAIYLFSFSNFLSNLEKNVWNYFYDEYTLIKYKYIDVNYHKTTKNRQVGYIFPTRICIWNVKWIPERFFI